MLPRNTLWLALFLALPLGLTACGGSPAPRPRPSSPPATPIKSSSAVQGSPVADKTRQATLAKQGAWHTESEKVAEFLPLVRGAAARHGLPEDLVLGVIWVESRFNPRATSPVGAQGLMQLMPRTAEYLAERIAWQGRARAFDPEFNIEAGTYYVARLIEEFDGDLDLALAAYNAGPTKVRRWLAAGGLPPVSIEYATMVQTARRFFGGSAQEGQLEEPAEVADTLDRLGLAILLAGLHDDGFGLEREDEASPLP